MQAPTRRPGTAARRLLAIAAATTSHGDSGKANPRRHWSASRTSGRHPDVIAAPAEEIGWVAKAMLAYGLFTRFKKPDFGFALCRIVEAEKGELPSLSASWATSAIESASARRTPTALRLPSTAAAVTAPASASNIDPVMMAALFVVGARA